MKSGTFTNNTQFSATTASVNVPTGDISVDGSVNFTVPPGVTVIRLLGEFPETYVGVTPNTTHTISIDLNEVRENIFRVEVMCSSHQITYAHDINQINDGDDFSYMEHILISWSPEINKETPDVTDY